MKNTFLKTLLSLGAVALFAGSLYASLSAHAQSDLIVEGNGVGATIGAERFIGEISLLDTVTLDPAVFNDLAFKSLVDFSRPLPEEVKGRTNPFAPIN